MARMKKIINLVLVIFIAASLASLAIACGEQGTVPAETQATEQQAEETTAPAETTATETAAQESGECPPSTSAKVESTNGAYVDRMPISWDSIGTQAAYLSHSTNQTAVFIYIANFETSENLKDVALSDGQAVIQFTLTVPGEGDPVPVSLGKYNVKEQVDNYASAGIRLTGGSTLSISTADIASADFEITSVTETEICGKFNIDEKWTKMSGEFKVPIVK